MALFFDKLLEVNNDDHIAFVSYANDANDLPWQPRWVDLRSPSQYHEILDFFESRQSGHFTGGTWQQTNVTTGMIHRFTSEVADGIIHAAGNLGGWITSDSPNFGQAWISNGLVGEVTDLAHGRTPGAGGKSRPGPLAPSGGTTWGTVSGTGVEAVAKRASIK